MKTTTSILRKITHCFTRSYVALLAEKCRHRSFITTCRKYDCAKVETVVFCGV